MTSAGELRPFTIDVPDEVLDDLRRRLADTRWPDQIAGTGWDLGTDLGTVRELCEYWRSEYDWRLAEVALNQWAQVETDIDLDVRPFLHDAAGS